MSESSAGNRRGDSDTGQRILDVALELFNKQGYDQTSLRQIADTLCLSKAALYYHFQSKADLLVNLDTHLHELEQAIAIRVAKTERGATLSVEDWVALLDVLIDKIEQNHDLFVFYERNRPALERLESEPASTSTMSSLRRQFRLLFDSSEIPLIERVRLVCALETILGALTSTEWEMVSTPTDDLITLVRKVVRKLLNPPGASRRPQRGEGVYT